MVHGEPFLGSQHATIPVAVIEIKKITEVLFASFNSVVDTRTSEIQMGPNILKSILDLTNNIFLISKNTLSDLKGPKRKYNLHYG